MVFLHGAAGSGFVPPGTSDFFFPPVFGNSILLTKPVLEVFLSVILISVFFIISARKAALVPSRVQFLGEEIYKFVRNGIGQDVIGPEFMRFVPYLFTVFVFILTNNIFGIVPILQFPTFSHIGFSIGLSLYTLVIYHWVGIKKHGFGKYLKEICFMPGVPKAIYIILTPVEVLTHFVTRPVTLSIRLFANMFGGHLLLLICTFGGNYLIHSSLFLKVLGGFSLTASIALSFFELGIQCLQAYVFTLLSALYIAGALAEEH